MALTFPLADPTVDFRAWARGARVAWDARTVPADADLDGPWHVAQAARAGARLELTRRLVAATLN